MDATADAERALAGHTRPARIAPRRLGDLFVDVQVVLASPEIWLNPADLDKSETQLAGRDSRVALLGFIPTPPPIDQCSTHSQQRRCVLEHHRLRRECTGRDDVVGANPLRPLLCTGAHDPGVLDTCRHSHALDEGALAGLALDERHGTPGQGNPQHQPGKAGTRTKVGDRLGPEQIPGSSSATRASAR